MSKPTAVPEEASGAIDEPPPYSEGEAPGAMDEPPPYSATQVMYCE